MAGETERPAPTEVRDERTLRRWCFTFDAVMRATVAEGGLSLDELVDAWTRPRPAQAEPAAQFELNRFSRDWHRRNPGRCHGEMLRAWSAHRSRPRD